MLRAFFGRLFGPPAPPPPRMVDLRNRLDDVEARVEYVHDELKQLRGRVTGGLRKRPPVESAVEGDGEEPVAEGLPAHAGLGKGPPSTAFLAKRFRRF